MTSTTGPAAQRCSRKRRTAKAGAEMMRSVLAVTSAMVTVIVMLLSFVLLSQAMRRLPLGTSYAVWTGIGSVGTVLLGTITELWQFYLYYALFVGSMGHAAFTVLLPVILTRWFKRHMGLAIGIYWGALGAGTVLFAPLFSWLIETRGWENRHGSVFVRRATRKTLPACPGAIGKSCANCSG